ncbi:MAG: Holliday junction branch migration protein RuvA [Syntrophaceae bacterium]|nr:Holliday junction branch migration protein RuvA [Syntrophaceae bacterium]NTW77194.1 Holliday junction branch migration protein RuvA [Syntrophaceae bacterium]
MIALICGKIAYKEIASVVIDTNGVGYRVFIPLTTFYELPEAGESVTLHVHTHVKEDAINLFGFYTTQERDLFQLMISVSGIGPKIAMNIISGITAGELFKAISGGNVGKLVSIPGVGRKMAERLILELKEKIAKKMTLEQVPAASDQQKGDEMIKEDVLSALVNLGYKNNTAKDALDKVLQITEEKLSLDALLKKTLKILAG